VLVAARRACRWPRAEVAFMIANPALTTSIPTSRCAWRRHCFRGADRRQRTCCTLTSRRSRWARSPWAASVEEGRAAKSADSRPLARNSHYQLPEHAMAILSCRASAIWSTDCRSLARLPSFQAFRHTGASARIRGQLRWSTPMLLTVSAEETPTGVSQAHRGSSLPMASPRRHGLHAYDSLENAEAGITSACLTERGSEANRSLLAL